MSLLNLRMFTINSDHYHVLRLHDASKGKYPDPDDSQSLFITTAHLWSGMITTSDGHSKCIYCMMGKGDALLCDVRIEDLLNLSRQCMMANDGVFNDNLVTRWMESLQLFYDELVSCDVKPAK